MRGWYIVSSPQERPGETTAWYMSFWEFCKQYLDERFGEHWCLSAEHSLALITGDQTVPRQVMVRSPRGGNKPISLLHETSILDVRLNMPPPEDVELLNGDGLRIYSLHAALIAASPNLYTSSPIIMRAALAMITDASEVLGGLLAGGHSVVAGRLAGALRNVGRVAIANTIIETMRAAGYTVAETDPFKEIAPVALNLRESSPYVNRMVMMWQMMRGSVHDNFPPPPQKKPDNKAYLESVDHVYVNDAYNSLSIEGYIVTKDLIEIVRAGNWHPDGAEDRGHRDALAARGYFQAFQRVKTSIASILEGKNAGEIAAVDHGAWYRELFGPSVAAGILKATDLAGYRSHQVFIRGSHYTPPASSKARELMPAFFDLLKNEQDPAVRVVLGHFIFVWIHPYGDGNGRLGRFLMNAMLASGGYPWTIVPVDRRNEYMAALESASAGGDIIPFTKFLASLL